MEAQINDVAVHFVEHGAGRPVVVLHGAGVDHREAEACFEPALRSVGRYRRIYPDLPGMGSTPAPKCLGSAEDVREFLFAFAEQIAGSQPMLVVGHSAGAYYARGMAALQPSRVAGLALVCPLLPGIRDVPPHEPVIASEVGDDSFREYFVVQTAAMWERYQRYVAPAIPLVDEVAAGRIGARWELSGTEGSTFPGPTLIVAGRQDSVVGSAAALDLLSEYPNATVALIDGAGHALPHEQPALLAALIGQWLDRVERECR